MVPDLMPLVCGLMTDMKLGRDLWGAIPKRSTLRLTMRIVDRLKVSE